MANLLNVHGRWVNLEKPGGQVFFVGGGTVAYRGIGASDKGAGTSPEQPLSTISQAVTLATAGRGDTIALLPGNVATTAVTTISKADITITGVGDSSAAHASSITGTGTFDTLDPTGTNITIENLHFPASGASIVSRINISAEGTTVRNCTFACGANDVETITIAAGGDEATIEDCRFFVTANGPEAAIEIEAAGANRLTVRNCVFNGGTNTNAWDTGSINSGVAHTNCVIEGNRSFESVAGIKFTAAATGIISNNILGGGTLGSMLDPGSCMCAENYEADAIDQSARLFPDTVAS